MPAPKSPLISKEIAIVCAVVGILSVVIAALVTIGLRNHESRSQELEGTVSDAALEVGIAPAALVPDGE